MAVCLLSDLIPAVFSAVVIVLDSLDSKIVIVQSSEWQQ